jgi:hypothetical protein
MSSHGRLRAHPLWMACLVSACALGFGAGLRHAAGSASPSRSQPPPRPWLHARIDPVAWAPSGTAAASAAPFTGPSPAEAPTDAGGETSDPEAMSQAERLVAGALGERSWRAPQAGEMRLLLPRLSSADRDALLRRLFSVINTGQVKVETRGPPI